MKPPSEQNRVYQVKNLMGNNSKMLLPIFPIFYWYVKLKYCLYQMRYPNFLEVDLAIWIIWINQDKLQEWIFEALNY